MANPEVTNTFTNSTTADATQVNTNFTDLINSMTDGTKSFSIDALTCAGAATLNGNVTLGNATGDDITITGSLAATINIKTNNSFNIGSATLGLASVYLGAPSDRSTRITAHQSLGASNTLVLPNGNGTAAYHMRTDGSGNLSFQHPDNSMAGNYSIAASVASSALTVALKGANGSDPSSTNPVDVVFRNATAATGTPVIVSFTAAESVVVPSGATLGHQSGQLGYIYVYLIDGDSSDEIAVCGSKLYEDGEIGSATAITTGSDSINVLYATSNHSDRPLRYIGRLISTQATAGTWDTAISTTSSTPMALGENVYAFCETDTTTGDNTITNNTFEAPDFEDVIVDTHGSITVGTGSNDWKFTAPLAGVYQISFFVGFGSSADWDTGNQAAAEIVKNPGGGETRYRCYFEEIQNDGITIPVQLNGSISLKLSSGDIIQLELFQVTGGTESLTGNPEQNWISIAKIGV